MKTAYLNKVTQLSVSMLKAIDVKYILLDIDNTIKLYGAKRPYEGIAMWLSQMKTHGIRVILFSNNFKSRVKPFSDALGIEYISFCLKPSPLGFLRAKKRLRAKSKEILVVGDQIFTDVIGARFMGMRALLVEPVCTSNERVTVKFRRFLLKGVKKKIVNRKNPF